jgi:hypothetical protein
MFTQNYGSRVAYLRNWRPNGNSRTAWTDEVIREPKFSGQLDSSRCPSTLSTTAPTQSAVLLLLFFLL